MKQFLVAEQPGQAAAVVDDGDHQQIVLIHDGEDFLAID